MTNRINTNHDVNTSTPVFVYDDQTFTTPNVVIIEAPVVKKDDTIKSDRPDILVKRRRRRRRLANRH